MLTGLVLLVGASYVFAEWPVSTPAQQGMDAARLAELDTHIQSHLPHVRSLLVARHGSLVFEKYYGDASRDGLQNTQSMTKSVTSALVGIALKKGLISSLDNKVLDYFPQYINVSPDPRVKDITIRHLLAMASGIGEMKLSFDKALTDPIPDILRQPLLYPPGAGFKYSSPAAHVLGGVLKKATGRGVLEFAETELFRPLGLGQVAWYADNMGLQSGGLSGLFRARDLLKIGELYLRRGTWQGRELIPAAYVAESVKVHNQGDFYGESVRYGYMWWIATVGGNDAFYARGYGGQYLMVIPAADLVILCTSDWKQPEYPEHFALTEKYILPSVKAK